MSDCGPKPKGKPRVVRIQVVKMQPVLQNNLNLEAQRIGSDDQLRGWGKEASYEGSQKRLS